MINYLPRENHVFCVKLILWHLCLQTWFCCNICDKESPLLLYLQEEEKLSLCLRMHLWDCILLLPPYHTATKVHISTGTAAATTSCIFVVISFHPACLWHRFPLYIAKSIEGGCRILVLVAPMSLRCEPPRGPSPPFQPSFHRRWPQCRW